MNNKFIILVFLSSIILSGCQTYSTGLYGTYAPSFSNGYQGLISWELEEESAIHRAMNYQCENYGGLDKSSIKRAPTPKNGPICCMKYMSYRCNGLEVVNRSSPTEKNSYYRDEIESNSREFDTIKEDSMKIDISDAKNKCISLGFKAGTEKFGDCVLKISK